jgi:hypothetical protein
MERLTVRQYAKKKKLSIYNVIKLARTGQIKSESVAENGKEVLYILDEEVDEKPRESGLQTPKTPEEEIVMLKARIKKLEEELAKCKRRR